MPNSVRAHPERAARHAAPLRVAAHHRTVKPFLAMDILAAANAREAAGLPTYHLEVGQPGAPVPPSILEAAQAALTSQRLGYTEAGGMQHLREAIAAHYEGRYGLSIDPQRIIVTTGSSAAFTLAFLMLCDAADRVALPRPGYPAYRNIVNALGLEPVELPLSVESGWSLSPETLMAEHGRVPIKALLIASPNNPTGTVIPPEALKALIDACRQAGIWFLSDEIYHGLTYEGEECCALTFDDEAIIINSFSKYFCMTGWRIGWMVVPRHLVRKAETFAQNLFICPPAISQAAALAALEATDVLETVKAGYAANRARLLETQARLGLAGGPPADGAFYLYWPVDRLLKPGEDAIQMCQALLKETGVAMTPGADFDPVDGRHFVRVSFAGAPAMITEAAERFETWALARIGG